MKRILMTSVLAILAMASTWAQQASTNNGTGEGYLGRTFRGFYHTEDGVLFLTFNDFYNGGAERCETLVKFPQSKNITTYTVPDGVYCIARGAFQGNKYLQKVRIPTSVYYVGEDAFRDCENLTSIETYETSTTYAKPIEMDTAENDDKQEVARYDLQGVPVKADAKGIQIVVFKDYTTKTVLNP